MPDFDHNHLAFDYPHCPSGFAVMDCIYFYKPTDTRFGTAVANYSTTILVGSVTEPLSVATQNAVTRNKSNTKMGLRNDRYRIWAQRKVGMLLGIQ